MGELNVYWSKVKVENSCTFTFTLTWHTQSQMYKMYQTLRIRDICLYKSISTKHAPLASLTSIRIRIALCHNFSTTAFRPSSTPLINTRQYRKFSANFLHTQLFNHINSHKLRVAGYIEKFRFISAASGTKE